MLFFELFSPDQKDATEDFIAPKNIHYHTKMWGPTLPYAPVPFRLRHISYDGNFASIFLIYCFKFQVLPLENNMKTPEDFGGWNGVLNTGMVIVAVLYTSIGFFGYLKYGGNVLGSITLNLPNTL